MGDTSKYRIFGDYLVEAVEGCTCGTPDPAHYGHEEHCGVEPVARLADIVAWAAMPTGADYLGIAKRGDTVIFRMPAGLYSESIQPELGRIAEERGLQFVFVWEEAEITIEKGENS